MQLNIKNKLLVAALFAGLAIMGIGARSAYADGDEYNSTINVSPMSQKIVLIPGERYEGTIKVSNPNLAKSDVEYSLRTQPFSTQGDDYAADTFTESTYTQIKDWIVFPESTGSVSPNETKTIPFYIDVPEDAPAGGQYATISVVNETAPETDVGNIAITSTMQVSSVLYATVAGDTNEEGVILSNNMNAFNFSTPLTGEFRVQNTGNVHFDTTTTLQVFPLFSNEELYTNAEDPQVNLIMPGTTRFATISWDNAPMVGIFRIVQTVDFAGQTSVMDKYVVICPSWLLVIIIAAIIGIFMWIFVKKKKSKK